MKKIATLTLLILLLSAIPLPADDADGIIEEINIARTDPERYIGYLMEWETRYTEKGIRLSDNLYMRTHEDASSVEEAIEYMKTLRPLRPLERVEGLDKAAREMVEMQGPTGQTGHFSPDGLRPANRANHYGKWNRVIGENIAYGLCDPRQIVMMWIIDDGVPKRDHRVNMFKPEYKVAGVAMGPHKEYGVLCVVDFAGGFQSFDSFE